VVTIATPSHTVLLSRAEAVFVHGDMYYSNWSAVFTEISLPVVRMCTLVSLWTSLC
jgi:hypothetical protein